MKTMDGKRRIEFPLKVVRRIKIEGCFRIGGCCKARHIVL